MKHSIDTRPGLQDGASRSVLVVENEAIIRMDLVAELKGHGFDVLEAAEGGAAVDLFLSNPDVASVIVDVELAGGLNGYDVVRAIRRDRPDCTMIIASARPPSMPAGFDEHVILANKPYDPAKIALILKDLRRSSKRRYIQADTNLSYG